MSITATLAQTAFKGFNFEVVSDEEQLVTYDIRTVYPKQAGIGANATSTTNDSQTYTINQTPTKFNIPIESSMASGEYVATLRVFSSGGGCGTVLFSKVGVFYLEARDITVDPIVVASENVEGVPQLTTSAPVVKANGVAIAPTDSFYAHYKFINLCLSATNVDPTGNEFTATTEYFVGDQVYDPAASSYTWAIADILPADGAYEEWGKLTIGNADSFVNDTKFTNYSKPIHKFGLPFTTDDTTVGYHLQDPVVVLVLGDVVGIVSDNTISLTLSNYAQYNDYPFDSIEMNIRETSDVTTDVLFTGTKTFSDFAGTSTVNFLVSDFTDVINGADTTPPIVNLVNGTVYHFQTVLKFTNSALFKPVQQRSVVTPGEFNDRILPIITANVVNSWILDPTKDAGLVLSFKKTSQYMGDSEALYNLDRYGVTTVLVEYTVLNSFGALMGDWTPLSGGFIDQGSVSYSPRGLMPTYVSHYTQTGLISFRFASPHGYNSGDTIVYSGATGDLEQLNGTYTIISLGLTDEQFAVATNIGGIPDIQIFGFNPGTIRSLNSANTDGVYTVPKNITSASLGPDQDDVHIYAEIPGQADYNLLAVRLTLTTNNAEFSPTQRTSTEFSVPPTAGYNYMSPYGLNINSASVRYFPKPEDHDFATDKPVIQLADADGLNKISFDVPVSVPRHFRSVMTTSGAGTVTGTTSPVGNDDAAYSGSVTGLSYVPTDNETFALTVAYKYSENNAVTTTPQSMTVQMQGFPNPSDKGFTIVSASWNQNTQKLDYVVAVNATATSVVREDAWTLYTKLSTEADSAYVNQGNVLKSAGLTQSLALPTYSNYSDIDVKVVATRSKYLSSTETTEQTETNTDNVDDAGIQTTQITKLPTELPKPTPDDITLSNPIYDTNASASQYAEVIVGKGATVYSIKVVDANNPADETIKTTTPSGFQIPINSTPTTKQYNISHGYQSYSSSGPATVYSGSTILEFTTGVNYATAPVIQSKQYVDASNFAIGYTGGATTNSSNSGDINLLSTIIGGTNDHFGPNDGSINASSHKDTDITLRVQNKFSSSYKVDTTIKALEQTINGPESASFRVAANPIIVSSSIVVRSMPNTITFDVRNNGAPYIDTALVMYAQDPSSNDGDKGTFGMGMFQNPAGFQVGVSQTNVFRGGLLNGEPTTAAHTLTASAITGTGYDKVTTFTFQSATDMTTANANVVLYVANAIEGSDSLVMPDITPTVPLVIIPYAVQLNSNGNITFAFTNNELSVGDTFVYSGATSGLSVLNGTYTVFIAYPGGVLVRSSILGQQIWSNYQPVGFNIGIVSIEP